MKQSLFILVALLLAPLACGAGEILHNGIALPDEWPPRPATFARDQPLVPPYLANPPKDTPLCNVWLTMLHGLGIPAERHGDSSGVVKKLRT